MNEKAIDNFVDLLFNFDINELENETKFLEKYKKLQQENTQLKERIDKALEITCKIFMNNADNRMICDEQEEEYFDWLDKELLKQEKILKGEDNG